MVKGGGLSLVLSLATCLRAGILNADALGWPSAHYDGGNTGASVGIGPNAPSVSWTLAVSPAASSPAADVGRPPLFDAHGFVYAFDYTGEGAVARARVADGALAWRVGLGVAPGAASTNGGIVLAADGASVVVASADGALRALDASDGSTLWTVPALACCCAVNAPAISGGRVVAVFSDGFVRAFDAASGAPLWRAPFGFAVSPLLNAQGGVAFGASGADGGDTVFVATIGNATDAGAAAVFAFRAGTGTRRWVAALPAVLAPTTELVVGGGRVFFGCALGVAALSADSGALLWRHAPSGHPETAVVSGAPVYSAQLGLVFVSELSSGVFALYEASGGNAWLGPDRYALVAGALDARGVLYVMNLNGELGAFAAANGSLLSRSAVPTALGASSPTLDGEGRLALFCSATSTLLMLGSGPPAPGAAAGGGGGVSLAAFVAVAVVGALAVAAAAALACRARACKVHAMLLRTQRSVATSMSERDGIEDPLMWTKAEAAMVAALEACALAEEAAAAAAAVEPSYLKTASGSDLVAIPLPTDGSFELPGAVTLAGSWTRALDGDSYVLGASSLGASSTRRHSRTTTILTAATVTFTRE